MSIATPAPAFPTLWRDTAAGRSEKWVGGFVLRATREQGDGRDFTGAVEALGFKKAVQIMHAEGE